MRGLSLDQNLGSRGGALGGLTADEVEARRDRRPLMVKPVPNDFVSPCREVSGTGNRDLSPRSIVHGKDHRAILRKGKGGAGLAMGRIRGDLHGERFGKAAAYDIPCPRHSADIRAVEVHMAF